MQMLATLLWIAYRARLSEIARRDERGSVVEKVILTAVFAGLAIAVSAIIVAKVKAKAHGIDLTTPPS
jgi:hypothetical protein